VLCNYINAQTCFLHDNPNAEKEFFRFTDLRKTNDLPHAQKLVKRIALPMKRFIILAFSVL